MDFCKLAAMAAEWTQEVERSVAEDADSELLLGPGAILTITLQRCDS